MIAVVLLDRATWDEQTKGGVLAPLCHVPQAGERVSLFAAQLEEGDAFEIGGERLGRRLEALVVHRRTDPEDPHQPAWLHFRSAGTLREGRYVPGDEGAPGVLLVPVVADGEPAEEVIALAEADDGE